MANKKHELVYTTFSNQCLYYDFALLHLPERTIYCFAFYIIIANQLNYVAYVLNHIFALLFRCHFNLISLNTNNCSVKFLTE